jgi:hypothetical protein
MSAGPIYCALRRSGAIRWILRRYSEDARFAPLYDHAAEEAARLRDLYSVEAVTADESGAIRRRLWRKVHAVAIRLIRADEPAQFREFVAYLRSGGGGHA